MKLKILANTCETLCGSHGILIVIFWVNWPVKCRKWLNQPHSFSIEMMNRFLSEKTSVGATVSKSWITTVRSGNLIWAVNVWVSVCVSVFVWDTRPPPAVSPCVEWQHQCGCTIADLCSVSDCINTEWDGSLMQNSSIDHFSEIPQPHSLSSAPFLSCQSIALCVDFYPLTNHSAPLALLSCQSSRRYCLIWSSSSPEFHILSWKSTISTKQEECLILVITTHIYIISCKNNCFDKDQYCCCFL